eukprot:TRINITY_DN1036_c0_g1_i1.p1 TRINITY_DN1036_c0_g1~~TRINITY_DN1036_c0_g1_i1.p1  ORF type:complete len:200 (+),score=37.93 TRINITY_DN1036_c0_g1_i1:78-677(+)
MRFSASILLPVSLLVVMVGLSLAVSIENDEEAPLKYDQHVTNSVPFNPFVCPWFTFRCSIVTHAHAHAHISLLIHIMSHKNVWQFIHFTIPIRLRAKNFVEKSIESSRVVVFSKTYCPFCKKSKETLKSLNPLVIELDTRDDMRYIALYLMEKTGQRTVPSIFIDGVHIGGNSDLETYKTTKKFIDLKHELNKEKKTEL